MKLTLNEILRKMVKAAAKTPLLKLIIVPLLALGAAVCEVLEKAVLAVRRLTPRRTMALVLAACMVFTQVPAMAFEGASAPLARITDSGAPTAPGGECVCAALCTQDAINADCGVCAAGFDGCTGAAGGDESAGDSANSGADSEQGACTCPPVDSGELVHGEDCPLYGGETAETCVCEVLCTVGAVNPACAVCGAYNADFASLCQGAPKSDALAAVYALIDALPTVDELGAVDTEGEGFAAYLAKLRADVTAARAAYDALTDEDKAAFDADALAKLMALEEVLTAMPVVMTAGKITTISGVTLDTSANLIDNRYLFANGNSIVLKLNPQSDATEGSTDIFLNGNKLNFGALGDDFNGGASLGTYANGYDLKTFKVYGGSNETAVTGDTSVTIEGGKVQLIYGGGMGENGTVSGNATVNLRGGEVGSGVYGGGDTTDKTVSGTETISVSGNPSISGNSIRLNVYEGGVQFISIPSSLTSYAGKVCVHVPESFPKGGVIAKAVDDYTLTETDVKAISVKIKYGSVPTDGYEPTLNAVDNTITAGVPEAAEIPLESSVTKLESGKTYTIADAAQLDKLSALVNDDITDDTDYTVKLLNNVTASVGFVPIGTFMKIFKGTFDGGDHVVELNLKDATKNYQGLFGYVGTSGIVQNVGVAGTVSGADNVGAVVSKNTGTVQNCYSTATVSGSQYVGGVVGENNGTVQNCYNTGTGTVTGESYVGGVVSYNMKAVISCYNTRAVSGDQVVGGVVGENYSGSVTSCYNTGAVSGTNQVGGVVGNNSATVQNCVSLGASVTRTSSTGTDFGRVVGILGSRGTLTGNKARSDMLVNGATVTGGTATDKNGEDVTVGDSTQQSDVFDSTAFSDTNGWAIPAGGTLTVDAVLPTLAGITAAQSPTLPEAEEPPFDPHTQTLYFGGGKLYYYTIVTGVKTEIPAGALEHWSADGSTLTLNNFNFTTSARYGLVVAEDSTIELLGDNTITSTYTSSTVNDESRGVYCLGSVTFKNDGTLTATGGNLTEAGSASYGIYSEGGFVLTFNECTVKAVGGTAGYSYGLYNYENLSLENGAKVTGLAANGTTISYGVCTSNGNLDIAGGCELTGEAGTAGKGNSQGILWSDSNPHPTTWRLWGWGGSAYDKPAQQGDGKTNSIYNFIALSGAPRVGLPKGKITRVEAEWTATGGATGEGTLTEALAAVKTTGGTVTLLNYVGDTDNPVVVEINSNFTKPVTLVLNGKTLTGLVHIMENPALFTIDGTAAYSQITGIGEAAIFSINSKLNLKGGIYVGGVRETAGRQMPAIMMTVETSDSAAVEKLKTLLAEGYAFADESEFKVITEDNASMAVTGRTVKVVPATLPKITITVNGNTTKYSGASLEAAVTASGVTANTITALKITAGEVTPEDWDYFAGGTPGSTAPRFSDLKTFEIGAAVTPVAKIPNGAEKKPIFPTSITGVTIPQAVTVGKQAFYGCANLTTVTLPKATDIGQEAFRYCWNLTDVSLPAATTIGANAFRVCEKLTTVSLPAATTIGEYAFYNCMALTTLKLGATVPSVGVRAFDSCPNVRSLVFVNASGNPLTGTDLTTAQENYDKVADGMPGSTATDGKWYGWRVRDTVATTPVASVTVNPTSKTMTVGENLTLTTVVLPANATNKGLDFTSDKTTVATVSPAGSVTALQAGTATITVKTMDGSNKTATCVVTVNAPHITGVTLNKASTMLAVGKTEQLTATVKPENAKNKEVKWQTSNPAAATVTDGLVTALKTGTATITATTVEGGFKATCAVTVTAKKPGGNAPGGELTAPLTQGKVDEVFGDGNATLDDKTKPSTIHINNDITVDKPIIVPAPITIDLGGSNITGGAGADPVIKVDGGTGVITGGGSITGGTGGAGVEVGGGGSVIIGGGTEVNGGDSSTGNGGDGITGGGSVIIGGGGSGAGGGSANGGNGGGSSGSGGDGVDVGGGITIGGGGSASGGNGAGSGAGGDGAQTGGSGGVDNNGSVSGGAGGSSGGNGGGGITTGDGNITVGGGEVSGGNGGGGTTGGTGGGGTNTGTGDTVVSGGEVNGGNGGNGSQSGGAGGDGSSSAGGGDITTGGGDVSGGNGGVGTGDKGTGGSGGDGSSTDGSITVDGGASSEGGKGGSGGAGGGSGGSGTNGGSTTIDGEADGGKGGSATTDGNGGNGGNGASQGGGTVNGGGTATGGNGGDGAGNGTGGAGGAGVGGGASAGGGLTANNGGNGRNANIKISGSAGGSVTVEDKEQLVDAVLSPTEQKDKTITAVTVTLTVEKKNNQPDKDKVESALSTSGELANVVGAYFDIALERIITQNGTQSEPKPVYNASGEVAITIAIPANMLGGSNYVVIRVHDGAAVALPTTQSGNNLSFSTDKFSTYAIAYTRGGGTDTDRPSGGSSGGATETGEYDFWMGVKDRIDASAEGDVVKVSVVSHDKMPASVMQALRENGVTLVIDWSGGDTVTIPAGKAQSADDGRVYYPISLLAELYKGVEFVEAPMAGGKVQSGKTQFNPETGGPGYITYADGKTGPVTGSVTQIEATAEPETAAGGAAAMTAVTVTPPTAGFEAGAYAGTPDAKAAAQSAETRGGGALPVAVVIFAGAIGGWLWTKKRAEK